MRWRSSQMTTLSRHPHYSKESFLEIRPRRSRSRIVHARESTLGTTGLEEAARGHIDRGAFGLSGTTAPDRETFNRCPQNGRAGSLLTPQDRAE